MKVSAPGKTFLVGEYLALRGGPSLLAATAPRFVLDTAGSGGAPFHPQSPAGALVSAHLVDTREWAFFDPHESRGGLGASTAQYLCAWVAIHGGVPRDWAALIAEYRKHAWDGAGEAPSGADLVAQACGHITSYDGRSANARVLAWPFDDLAFTVVRTGEKLATHKTLREGAPAFDEVSLRAVVERATTALSEANRDAFLASINEYGELLRRAGLLAPYSAGLLDEIRGEIPGRMGLHAAKGCGAMGADVLLLVHGAERANELRSWCEDRGLAVCASEAELAGGVRIEK